MSLRHVLAALCGLGLTLGSMPKVRAADEDKDGPVYTDPAQADEDFAFQGEYRGYQQARPSSRSSEPVGLQVVALGDGKFSAVKYYGGLPGEGWFGGQRFEISGERLGDVVHLHGGQYEIELIDGQALIRTLDGRPAGALRKRQRVSPTMGASPPPGAIRLFDGQAGAYLRDAKVTDDGLLMAGTETVDAYGDFRLHGEFRLPYKPFARGQARGNSGFYLQSRYEVQVLDSFGLEGVENECGALYKTRRPDVNMCFPPLQWQTYDIDFTAARFDDQGNKTADMRISVWHNGILVHNNAAIPNKTGNGKPEAAMPLPIKIQDHRNPVVYRNVWLIPKTESPRHSADWVQLPLKTPPVPIFVSQSR